MDPLAHRLKIPDVWQQEAVKQLKEGRDVVVQAPTGTGKTYIFELLVNAGLKRQAIYTVPTRALANDKLAEWRTMGWHVGICTGDVSEKLDAPLIVATLETQKGKFLRGLGPGLLVIDEYQMLADPGRGVNYELAIALAPPGTQLLLLSGSVANPEKIVQWLKRIGRDAALIHHQQRPVPLDEILMDALPDRIPSGIRGFWPRFMARALMADLGPILLFAPQRKEAEDLARQLAAALPTPDWLELTPEQRHLAGDSLSKLLRARITYHHSGLSYQQRAGLIEPLAKAGQLRIIVATTGLASGINFSVRSVAVTDREYIHGGRSRIVQADELLQMFGRAGRRGLDEKGYVLVAPGKPRLSEARPLPLKRCSNVDWASFLAVMHQAVKSGQSPVAAAESLSTRLFSETPVPLGLKRLDTAKMRQILKREMETPVPEQVKIKEMLNSAGQWERQRPQSRNRLGDTFIYLNGEWRNALEVPESLAGIKVGNLCLLKKGRRKTYGRMIPVATFPQESNRATVILVKYLHRQVREHFIRHRPNEAPPGRHWPLEQLEKDLFPILPHLTQGGRLLDLLENKGLIQARLDYSEAIVMARVDSHGCALINPPYRIVTPPPFPRFAEIAAPEEALSQQTIAEVWYRLGLIDGEKHPTRRGVIFSFFNHGEGLAIAAALEDKAYDLHDLLFDLANLRAGHRFSNQENASNRLAAVCRMAYRGATWPGYLEQGVPPEYGDGAAEIVAAIKSQGMDLAKFINDTLGSGDIERAILEWKSILNHIASMPDYDWDRWQDFKELVRTFLASHFNVIRAQNLPPLTAAQKQRVTHFRLSL